MVVLSVGPTDPGYSLVSSASLYSLFQQQDDFCVVGKFVTKCFCKQTGCNVHVKQILVSFTSFTHFLELS